MQSPSSVKHLGPAVLRALGAGQLDAAKVQEVMAHLESCPECRQLRAAQPVQATTPYTVNPAGAAALPPSAATAPYAPPAVLPELIDHPQYEVLRELGRGGMGVVYLAKNKMMDRPEVLKVVNKQLLNHAGAAERFLREIRSAASLSHPNIVIAHSVLQVGELLVFAMEYVEGENLAQLVYAHGRLPVANACYYAQQVALGLQHAFEKGMVHRDIKPQNLILARVGKKHLVKVLDFGLAKATREKEGVGESGLTGTGTMLGTPDYIAPEQTLDAAKADIRADIYSLGCTLYFLLAGKPPFQGKSQFELLQAHHVKEATPLDQVREDVPAALSAVAAKMMAKDPGKRYQKPMEVAQALTPFVKEGAKRVPAAEAVTTLPAGGKMAPRKGSEQDTAGPAPVMQRTVIEGSATMARAARKTDPGKAQPDTAVPGIQGTVIEGSSTIARASEMPALRPRSRDLVPRGGGMLKFFLVVCVLLLMAFLGAAGVVAYYFLFLAPSDSPGPLPATNKDTPKDPFLAAQIIKLEPSRSVTQTGTLETATSEVLFQFTGPASGMVVVYFDLLDGASIDCRLTALDSQRREIAQNDSAPDRRATMIQFHVNADESYFVKVSAFDGGTGKFKLRFAHVVHVGSDFNNALEIRLNKAGTANQTWHLSTQGEIDMFRLIAPFDGVMVPTLSYPANSFLDGRLYAYDSNSPPRAIVNITGPGGFPVDRGRTYYLMVTAWDQPLPGKTRTGAYTLNIRIDPKSGLGGK